MRAVTVVLMAQVLCGALAANANAQSAARGAAGLGKALSDLSGRYIDQELEIETARKLAEIEIETQRRLQELKREAPRTEQTGAASPAASPAAEEKLLTSLHPQWIRIITSTAFNNFLNAAPASFAQTCRSTHRAVVLSQCIDDFFGPQVQAGPAR